MTLRLSTISLAEANDFVARHHRHAGPVVGHKFSLAALNGNDAVVGVAIVGRPVARMRDDGMTLEVTRLCTDGTRNACSFLYGASARAAFALGYRRIGTYIRANDETGVSLLAANWRRIGQTRGRQWSTPSRPRAPDPSAQDRVLFEASA